MHEKWLHIDFNNAVLFVCSNCSDEFKHERSIENHYSRCGGERIVNGKKECKNCIKQIAKASFARYRPSDYLVELVKRNYNTCQKSLGHFQKIMKNYSLISISTIMP